MAMRGLRTIDEMPNQIKRRELKALTLQYHIPNFIGNETT